jgi:uncharacterized protein
LKRVVLDTNVVVSAILWGGTPRQLFELADAGQITLFTSIELLRELTGILSRDKFAEKIAATGQSIDQIVDGYAAYAEIVRPAATTRIAPDPDDDVVLGTALAAKAEMIVTGDRPFLSVEQWRNIGVVTVGDAIIKIGER